MNERLEQFIKAENITQAKFADTLDVARASISHILAGRNKPGYDFITSLMDHYPDLNIEWLLTGKGKMYKSKSLAENEKKTADSPSLTDSPLAVNGSTGLLFGDDEPYELAETPRETEISRTPRYAQANIQATQREHTPSNLTLSPAAKRVADKIVVFYSDGTFEEIRLG
ncbi:MAG: helix-turn-helix transcriptional regulator [Bacteroidales bacterium]|nr:helix-turn-helix transcriptional regulator [Bacteroidales bacterium]